MIAVNEILLRRKNKVILEKGSAAVADCRAVATIMKNVEALGYTFSQALTERLQTFDRSELLRFYQELLPLLKGLVGADVVYRPMYPNFPESVMEEDYARLFLNAVFHYWSEGRLYPYEEKNERLPLFDETGVSVLDLGTPQDMQDIFTLLCQSKTSLSQTDKEDLAWLFEHESLVLPEEIPLKENAALVGKLYLENVPVAQAAQLARFCRTATDVLRLITAMSDGDISLAENTRFRSFKRRERRILMALLAGCGSIEEDMLRYKNKWIRVGERLHPSEYGKAQFAKVTEAFYKLRNDVKIETFAGKVTRAMEVADYSSALCMLKERPGELARKLDLLLRNTDDKEQVIAAFRETAGAVSTPVLLQVREHFMRRTEKTDIRVFFPKGSLARCHYIENTLPDIEKTYCDRIVGICEKALMEQYGKRGLLGRVYLSEAFRRFIVPFSQRSAGKTLKTVTRGSRMPFGQHTKAFRAFIWWTNTGEGETPDRVDIDLSAAFFDENWQYLEHVSYTNLRSAKYRACHSGDIVNGGPKSGAGVSEFLDVDIDSAVEYGARYIVYQVYNYTGQKYADIPNAKFGWMGREDVKSGEIYEPRTVEQRMDLAAQSTVSIPVIFDCVEREVIWCDMGLSINGCRADCGGNNVESNLSSVAAVCYSMVHIEKPNLYDLIDLHIRARGRRVPDRNGADIVFDLESGITPFDTEVFMGQYL